jgi:hypothetical protein
MSDAWGHSWGGPFTRWIRWGAVAQAADPNTFGPPFLDARSPLLGSLGAFSPLVTAMGARSAVSPHIERESQFPSARIDRSSL